MSDEAIQADAEDDYGVTTPTTDSRKRTSKGNRKEQNRRYRLKKPLKNAQAQARYREKVREAIKKGLRDK